MAESKQSEDLNAEVKKEGTEDLDSLLDSALEDFTELDKEKDASKDEAESNVLTNSKEEADSMWAEMIKQAFDVDPTIRDMFQQGSSEENKFVQDFSRIAEAAAKAIDGDTSNNFTNIMQETLKNLNDNSEAIKSQFSNPDELANIFQEMGLTRGELAGEVTADDMPPFMQSIMQTFLSKETLYPPMKNFVDRYPAWLEEHKSTLPAEQFQAYSQQLELMRLVVEEFEAENPADSDDVKKQRFHRIMDHMQKMQGYGNPPADLMNADGDLPITLDESNLEMPPLPPGVDPNQCSVM